MSETYHKIPNIFKRTEDKEHKFKIWNWYTPELEALAHSNIWHLTEKIDGTNIRVIWDGHDVTFLGKKSQDPANVPGRLRLHLEETFKDAEDLFEQNFGDTPVTIYGEGFGHKIQNGGDYFPDEVEGKNEFVPFDVKIDGNYQTRETVEEICDGIFNLPLIFNEGPVSLFEVVRTTISEVENSQEPVSEFGKKKEIEGYIAKTDPELYDRRGNRIITKIKYADFQSVYDKENGEWI